MDLPILLLNLDRSPERLEAMSARLSALGLSFERMPAVDGSQLSRADVAERFPGLLHDFDASVGRGALGCYMSHINAARLILERDYPAACILEDDAEFSQDFGLFMRAAYPAQAEAIKLECTSKRRWIPCLSITRLHRRRVAYVPGTNANGSACYILTRAGAQKIVDILPQRWLGSVDHVIFDPRVSKIRTLHVLPYPVRQLSCGASGGSIPSTVSLYPKPKKKRKTLHQILKKRAYGAKQFWANWMAAREVAHLTALRLAAIQ
jgi:glycosyl transferase family 25